MGLGSHWAGCQGAGKERGQGRQVAVEMVVEEFGFILSRAGCHWASAT